MSSLGGGGKSADHFATRNTAKEVPTTVGRLTNYRRILGAVALTVGSVTRRIVSELRHFHWLMKMNNQSN